jgi:hypothetical protein
MYQVTFIDGTNFTGGEPNCSLWDQIPKKPIKSITYWLSETCKFFFTDFEEYGHLVERIQVFNQADPSGRPQERVTKAILMGRVGKRVYEVVYDLKRGATYQLVTKYGEEYSNQERLGKDRSFLGWENGKAVLGWRPGILNSESGPKLKRIEL